MSSLRKGLGKDGVQSCRNCAYLAEGWRFPECHRHAPQLSIERACDDPAIETISRWPNVSLSDWCGDYATKKKARVKQ